MARLHEFQGKAILAERGVLIPRGGSASTPDEARAIAAEIGAPVVIKIQAWTTGRASIGGVAFAQDPDEAASVADRMLRMKVGAFPVEQILVEEKIVIERELFISLSIDDAARAPVILLSLEGGSGVEDRAARVKRIPAHVSSGPDPGEVARELAASTIDSALHIAIAELIGTVFRIARDIEARSLEINPVAITSDGRLIAADCRMTVDDYAVFRHPELGIDIARELDHPPTRLERIAYDMEQRDHRGTFYFAQLPHTGGKDERLIGFHGAGGGGSMMSMDAVTQEGFTLANFCDTSGNPSAAKVYAAARIILAQPGIIGYFGSGSGVASQEQFWSAYGLAKAFVEMNLSVPAVIRLGGNNEDRAVDILEDVCKCLPTKVEGYKKDDTPSSCAERFSDLVGSVRGTGASMRRTVPEFVGAADALRIPINGGDVWIDLPSCDAHTTDLIIRHSAGLLHDESGKPALAVAQEEVAGKDSEFIACEIECRRAGRPVVFVDLPIPGLDDEPLPDASAAAPATVGGN